MSTIVACLASVLFMGGLAAASASAAAPPGTSSSPGTRVEALPLKRGFYVATGTPCRQASTATMLLVTRQGVNGAHDACTFRKLEKTAATRYRVVESCARETTTVTYQVPNQTSFIWTSASGQQKTMRYCAQSSLPDPWRDNDISDL